MIEDRLVLTARGRPKDTFEQCCSFLMILKAKKNDSLITGFDKDFTYIKLDPLVYPQLITVPQVKKASEENEYCQITVVQENNF